MTAASESADWLARGRTHQWEGRPVDAMLCFRRASRADPRAPDPLFALGEVLWQFGRVPDALASWREAARLDGKFLAPWQALAEASLATGDAKGARAAAERVRTLAPGNARAEMIAAIACLMDDEPAIAASTATIGRVLEQDPDLAGASALGGALALALDRAPRAPEIDALLEHIGRSSETLSSAPLLLLALALERSAALSVAELKTMLGTARSRAVAPAEFDALRRIAFAAARSDATTGHELGKRLAGLCAANAPAVPLQWPRRSAGTKTRVVALVAGEAADGATLAALCRLAPNEVAVTFASFGTPSFSLPEPAAHLVLPPAADAAGKAIAALDPDVLVDFDGMSAPSHPLLSQRPARRTWTTAKVPYAPPLVDRAFTDFEALAGALRTLHREKSAAEECPLDAAAMAIEWTSALRAHQQRDTATALAGYTRVLELQPGFAPAHYFSGIAQRDDGADAAARASFAAALASAPGYVEARLAAVNAAIAAGDFDEALDLCDAGLRANPSHAPLLRAQGRTHLARSDGSAAADSFARALQLDMADGETHYNLGVALQMQRYFPEAARAYQRALAFRPDLVAAHFNLGVLFQEQGMTDAAIAAYSEVLAVDPASISAYRNVGEVLLAAGRIDAYVANFRRFESKCPTALPLAVQALVACQHMADFARFERYLDGLRQDRFAARNEAELVDALEEILYLLLYYDVEPSLVDHFSRIYDAAARRAYGEPVPLSDARRPGRVRVGYLSGDLRNHVMGKMAWAALEHHDKERFELFFYSLSEQDDEWTAMFRGLADHFHTFAYETEREAALRVAADDLDILVDLSTHTKGARPGILALKPARVQLTHVASAGTVGLSTIDFKLTDAFADLPENQALQLEPMLPIDGCVYPYRHIAPTPVHTFHRANLGIASDAVLIGAFVSPLKLSRRCLTLWRDVLARIPRARIALSPVDASLRGTYERLFAAAGIAQDKYLFLPQGRDDGENQARYGLIDFVLDPMPYGGVNGTLEAVDAGIPVVTMLGKRHGERTSYSILANLGVTDTVATSGTEYVEIAIRLATDPAFMRDVRKRIRDGLAQSPLTDRVAHTRALERAYLVALAAKAPDVLRATAETADG